MTSTLTSQATVATEKPSVHATALQALRPQGRRRLHRRRGYIQFEVGRCELRVSDDELYLTVTAADEEGRERVRNVVGSHLERFGKRDELSVSWS